MGLRLGRPVLLKVANVQGRQVLAPRVALGGFPHPLGLRWVDLLQIRGMLPSAPAT